MEHTACNRRTKEVSLAVGHGMLHAHVAVNGRFFRSLTGTMGRNLNLAAVFSFWDANLFPMSKLGIAIAALLSASAMAVGYSAWWAMADVEMSVSGYIAMGLGAVASLAVGGGLMGLLFWSNRKGFDDRAGLRPQLQERKSPHNS